MDDYRQCPQTQAHLAKEVRGILREQESSNGAPGDVAVTQLLIPIAGRPALFVSVGLSRAIGFELFWFGPDATRDEGADLVSAAAHHVITSTSVGRTFLHGDRRFEFEPQVTTHRTSEPLLVAIAEACPMSPGVLTELVERHPGGRRANLFRPVQPDLFAGACATPDQQLIGVGFGRMRPSLAYAGVRMEHRWH